ncbi:hypothetical protein C0991_009251 [Blastosporella zonata]|nr:hypothetical protein C0991_009251 [Blastosporella zonata]
MDADEPSSDPALLFPPANKAQNSDGRVFSPLNATLPPPTQRGFFILPPHIPDEQKKLYKAAKETSLATGSEILLDEVIGKYHERKISYYYARHKKGEACGDLEPFDPSAHYIHPLSRVRVTVSIINRHATVNISSARSIRSPEVVPDSQDEDAMEIDESSDDDESNFEETEKLPLLHPSTRSSGRRKQALPFSPKKTRSARLIIIDSDVETGDSEKSITIHPSRRSTRNSTRHPKKLEESGSGADTDGADLSYGDNEGYNGRPKVKTKKLVRNKESRPAYGHFRSVADLDNDLHFGEETGPTQKHRDICEKCHEPPAHKLLRAISMKGKRRSKKKKNDEFEDSDDEERLIGLGGWVRCLKCPVVAHWKCMANTQRDEILKAARDRDRAAWEQNKPDGNHISADPEPEKRPGLDISQTTEFICGACIKGGFCMACMEVALEADAVQKEKRLSDVQDSTTADDSSATPLEPASDSEKQLLFRCMTCKRLAHYEHLPPPSPGDTIDEIAHHYTQIWLCADCASYTFGVDRIIAWRPYPATATKPARQRDEPPNYKSSLPREYLVKWLDRSFKRVQWVPHMWLLSTHPGKLKNFILGGSKVELMESADASEQDDDQPGSTFEIGDESRASSTKPPGSTPVLPQEAIPDAERRIPPAWKTIDRLLDVLLWRCGPSQELENKRKRKNKGKGKGRERLSNGTDDDVDEIGNVLDKDMLEERELAFDQGEQPSDQLVERVSEWEERTGRVFTEQDIELVAWAFIKWQDLGYDEASWDSPPRPSGYGHEAYRSALHRYIYSRTVIVPNHSVSYCEKFDNREKNEYRARHGLNKAEDLDIGQDPQLKLMPFQVDGFNWLCNNWWVHQPCILADEMGLKTMTEISPLGQGKTVQVATFLGNIAANFEAFPALVVVPNSTITNWVREFERWAPKLRVVPFFGEGKAREIIKKYELYHETRGAHETGAKFHVLITTYEALLNQKDFTPVFKKQPRWEASKWMWKAVITQLTLRV